jgi:hypothetical protein
VIQASRSLLAVFVGTFGFALVNFCGRVMGDAANEKVDLRFISAVLRSFFLSLVSTFSLRAVTLSGCFGLDRRDALILEGMDLHFPMCIE